MQENQLYEQMSMKEYMDLFTGGGAAKRKQVKNSRREAAAEKLLRASEISGAGSAAGTTRLKRLIKPPA